MDSGVDGPPGRCWKPQGDLLAVGLCERSLLKEVRYDD